MDEDYLRDLFSEAAPLSFRKMFGGLGIYTGGVIFAVILRDDRVMLKGDGLCAAGYEAAGMQRWTYANRKSGKQVLMPYWYAPEQSLESADDMAPFARMAVAAALRSRNT